ncbi:MAG: RNA pseudouridine synthase [Pirellulaceae bacterium]|nr:MAG: RNA pseudouridine synthase [Pirellulaceae bacterium]
MIPILCEDPSFLVINKPAGWLCQAPPGVPNLQAELAAQIKQRDGHPGNPFVGLPHRLDRSTTGTLLVARHQRALKRFCAQFQSRKIRKWYLAVVEGELPPGAPMRWIDYVRKLPGQPVAEIVPDRAAEHAREAVLEAHVLAAADGCSLLKIDLHTGRMHQIRIQAASRGWPVVGDQLYGANRVLAPVATSADSDTAYREMRIALHAARLEFFHPTTAKKVHVVAPLPEYWHELPGIMKVASDWLQRPVP